MTKLVKSKGRVLLNGKTVIPNELKQEAFDLLMGLLTGGITEVTFGNIALLDASEDVIAEKLPVYSSAPATLPDVGGTITGEAAFESTLVTADVHYLALKDTDGTVLAQATLAVPVGAGESINITRIDQFTPVT